MTILFLIRHGENDFLKDGILIGSNILAHLNKEGQIQARLIAESLKAYPIKTIYSSPLERAVETALLLAKLKNISIRIKPELHDTNVGEWAGRKVEELKKLPAWKQVQEKPANFTFPSGESFNDLQERMVKAIDAIIEARTRKEIVAVFSHADPIKLVIAHFLGLPLDNFQRLQIDTGSISILTFGKGSARLTAMNIKPPFPKLTL